MTDSESDVGVIHVRNRLLELLYSSDTVFFVDQIARILAVDEARILQELKLYSYKDLVYDPVERTVQVRAPRRRTLPLDVIGSVCDMNTAVAHGAMRATGTPEPHYAKYGSDGSYRNRASPVGGGLGKSSKSALRKTKYRRPAGAVAVSGREGIDFAESTSPKGRVGYVCVADEFRLGELETHYRAQGYCTKFDFGVLHIRFSDKEISSKETHLFATANKATVHSTGGEKMSDQFAMHFKNPRKVGFDLFLFEYGAIVWWGFDQRFFKIVESDFMLPNSAISGYMVNRYMTQLVSENYPVWCTYTLERKETLEPDEHFRERLRFDHFIIPFSSADLDTSNVSMLCVSHALAQSAKIDYLELKVQELTDSCSPLPRELREKGHVTITERRLLQLRGEVLSYRLMLKSGSNLMDEPDFFWENAYLKPVFQATKECFEIVERVEALDNKLDAANEILSMLAEEFSQRHGARLEWIVIWLVFAEVVIGILELVINLKPWFYRRL